MRECEFQRRHFEFLAAVIKDLPLAEDDRATVAKFFARKLRVTSSGFKPERFEAACNVEVVGA